MMAGRFTAVDASAIHPAGASGTSDRAIPPAFIDVHAKHQRDDGDDPILPPDKKPIGRFMLTAVLAGLAAGALTMSALPKERAVSAVFQIRPDAREIFEACRTNFGTYASQAALDIAGNNKPWPWLVIHRSDRRELVLTVAPAESYEVAALAERIASQLRTLIDDMAPDASDQAVENQVQPKEQMAATEKQLKTLNDQLAGLADTLQSSSGHSARFDERQLDIINQTATEVESIAAAHRAARNAYIEATNTPVPMTAEIDAATRTRILDADPELRNDHQELRIRAANLRDALNRVMNEADAPIAQYDNALAALQAAASLDENRNMAQPARRVVEQCAVAADLLRTAFDEFRRAWTLAGEKANIAADAEDFSNLIDAHDNAVAAYEAWLTDSNRALDRINERIRAAGTELPDDAAIDQLRHHYNEFWAVRQVLAERIERIRGQHNVAIDAAGGTLRLIYRRYERRKTVIDSVLEGEALREARRRHLDRIDATRQSLVDASNKLADALSAATNLARQQQAAIREITSQPDGPGRLIQAGRTVNDIQENLNQITNRIESIDLAPPPQIDRGETVALRIEEHLRNRHNRSGPAWSVTIGLLVGILTLWAQAGLHSRK